MSRAAVTKSRAEKSKGGGTAAPAVAHEIVSGKFTEHDWYSMLDRDDGTEFSLELVDDIVDSALTVIYNSYIQEQLLPFTLSQAKDAILQIIDWQFLSRDELETDISNDISWQQDEEPLPALTDCWAQGVVPKQDVPASRLSTPQLTQTIREEPDREELEAKMFSKPTQEVERPAPQPDEEETTEGASDGTLTTFSESTVSEPAKEKAHVKVKEFVPEPPKDAKSKRKFVPNKGRMKSAGLGNLTESLYDTEKRLIAEERHRRLQELGVSNLPQSHSTVRSQAGRTTGGKDMIYDTQGNLVGVVKFNPAKLPSHFVKTGFSVVDPDVEAAQARLQAMKTGGYVSQTNLNKKKISGTSLNRKSLTSQENISPRSMVLPLPPPLIEMMDVSAGVTVKEGERVKRGPKKWGKTGPQVGEEQLRVVRPPPERPKFTAADLLGTDKPMLKMMMKDSQPVPPIKPIST